VKTGCLQFYKEKNFTHTYEANWNLKDKEFKGLFGFPFVVAAGGKYVLSDKSSLTYSAEASAKFAA